MNIQNVNGNEYSFNKIPALAQFHIVRRLAPIIGDLLAAISPLVKDKKLTGNNEGFNLNEEEMLKIISPIMTSLSKLSDEDANYAIFGLLKHVKRKVTSQGGWANVVNGEVLMYEDINMPVMIQLCVKSFIENMSGFINALPSGLKEGAINQASQSNG